MQVRVVLLDNHVAGPLDVVWDKVFSQGGPVRRAKDFAADASGGLCCSLHLALVVVQ